ncbi:MAG: tripartite tricarboxylate transporter permease [Nanoarchaeota archaeon]|mgnify:FL=1
MLMEIFLFLLLGVFAGVFTGLAPGIHINLVGAILVSLSLSIFSNINPVYLVVFIVAMSITHSFVDFIPSIFLGCPDAETSLSVLPGHEMLREGRGYEAVMLANTGSLAAILILIPLSVPLVILIPKIYYIIEKAIPYLLISVTAFMVFSEKEKFSAFFVLAISGILGLIVLNFNGLNEPLLPLLSGLFGASTLLISLKEKTKMPKQEITKPNEKIMKLVFGSIVASLFCGFLPGLGGGQAAVMGNLISKSDKRGFLVLLGATNVLVMSFSFIALYAISKTRTGVAVSIQELIGTPNIKIFILIIFTIIISGILSFFITEKLAKFFSSKMEKINYSILSIVALIFISIIVLIFSGILGFLVFLISTATGIYCISFNVRRTNMIGCLLLPTIILYLFG